MWVEINSSLINLDGVSEIYIDNNDSSFLNLKYAGNVDISCPFDNPEDAQECFYKLIELLNVSNSFGKKEYLRKVN